MSDPIITPHIVFTPGKLPTLTYYSRPAFALESKLKNALTAGGSVVSISGSSKSGKTVLCKTLITEENMILVEGSAVKEEGDFWRYIRGRLALPRSFSTNEGTGSTNTKTRKGSLELGAPPIKVVLGRERAQGNTATRTIVSEYDGADGIEMLEEVRDRGLVLAVDDFHYIPPDVQKSLARQFKSAVFNDVKILVISIPLRDGDPVRVNSDLKTRLRKIDIPFWNLEELQAIAEKGFPRLNIDLHSDDVRYLATQSLTSPQLMQSLCLQLCESHSIFAPFERTHRIQLKQEQREQVCREFAAQTCNTRTVRILRSGPRERGTSRKEFPMSEGVSGDIYTVVLKAIGADPPALDFDYLDIRNRAAQFVIGNGPQEAQIKRAMIQLHTIVDPRHQDDRVLRWDSSTERLYILDPHFLFELRWATWQHLPA